MVLPSTSKTFVWKSTPAIQTKRLWLIQRHRSNKYGYFYIQRAFILNGLRMYLMLSWGWEQIFLCTVSWWSWICPRLHPRPARSCTSSLGPGRLWKSQWTEKKTKMHCDAYDLRFTKFRYSTENMDLNFICLKRREPRSRWNSNLPLGLLSFDEDDCFCSREIWDWHEKIWCLVHLAEFAAAALDCHWGTPTQPRFHHEIPVPFNKKTSTWNIYSIFLYNG